MRVGIVMGRGVEGCGVTRYVNEARRAWENLGHEVLVFVGQDKKWPREKMHPVNGEVLRFNAGSFIDAKSRIDGCDVVFLFSIPSKSHSPEFCQKFLGMTRESSVPKFLIQTDHSPMSFARNFEMWEILRHCHGAFTHDMKSPFAKKAENEAPNLCVMKMGLGLDCDELHDKYWLPVSEKTWRFSYFGRFAFFKKPKWILDFLHPCNEREMAVCAVGLEKSIGMVDGYWRLKSKQKPLDPRVKFVCENFEKDKDEKFNYLGCVHSYGCYEHDAGLKFLSQCAFGADFYTLPSESYGDNFEFAMCEIIACGVVPVFSRHWAEHCTHLGTGKLFKDLEKFALLHDGTPGSAASVAKEMSLLSDSTLYDEFREQSFQYLKSHCDSKMIFSKMLEDATRRTS